MNAPLPSTLQQVNQFSKWFTPRPALQDKSLMDHLFNRLDGLYPHKWRSNFPTPDAIDNWQCAWAETFEEHGITPDQIKAGLKACQTKYEWPPSCAEFIKACKPVVDSVVAYYEALNGMQERERGEMGKWTHPAVFWAAVSVSAFDLKNLTYSQIKARWEAAFLEEIGKSEWPEIPKPMLALPAPGKSELSREKATQMIADLNAKGITKSPEEKTDHKRWAKKILERHEKGDKTLSPLQVKFAKEALSAA